MHFSCTAIAYYNLYMFNPFRLTLKLQGEGQIAIPLNLNDKNIPNADFILVF